MPRRRAPKVKKPSGRVKGIPVPSSEKFARANRTKGWKHGLRSRVVTVVEGRTAQLAKLHPEAPGLMAATVQALTDGGLDEVNAIAAQAFVETEILRRKSVDRILEDGVTVRDGLIDKDGTEIGHRLKAHPLFEPVRHMQNSLGYTGAEMRLTSKSRGEGDRDDAITKRLLERRAFLQAYDKSKMPRLPGPAQGDQEEPLEGEIVAPKSEPVER
ncbi:MAG: hypothetical protein WEB59_07990 [Thermoanaerobaculia bacterium]